MEIGRPGTLAEAIHLGSRDVENFRYYIDGFLDEFYLDTTQEGRLSRIQDRPELLTDKKINALAGAIGEHLARRWFLGSIPEWTNEPERFLSRPWFLGHERMRAFNIAESPSAYRRRMIFTEIEPLRRARMPRDGRWWAYEQLRGGLVPTQEEIEEYSKHPTPYS